MKVNTVCVIGAGVSGLASAKVFLEEGYDITVFEKQKGLGGVWEKSRTYPGLTTQSPRDTYAFPDYPMPVSYPEWPSADQIRTYLESYAQHFEITQKIRFNTEVIQVERKIGQKSGWIVSVRTQDSFSENFTVEQYEFDFVLVCNGAYHIPNIPEIPGKEEFIASGGQVLHTTEVNDPSLMKEKRTVVVGCGKSAVDIATLGVNHAIDCTLVFRQIPWLASRFFLGRINIKYITLNRFAEMWLPYRHLKGLERILHTIGKPLAWAFWRLNEIILRLQFGLDTCGMLPEKPLQQWIIASLGIAPKDFYKNIQSGKIRTKKSKVSRFVPSGVELDNGDRLQADLVVFGTGFRQDVPFLEEKYRRLMIDDRGSFHLYRNILHPQIPQMGFIGYNTSKFCPLTFHLSARWLVEYTLGNLTLPSAEEMLAQMEEEWNWKQTEWGEKSLDNGTSIFPFTFHYIEELLNDLGIGDRQQGWQRILQAVTPIDPSAYKDLRQQLQMEETVLVVDSEAPNLVGSSRS
ncbi:MAG: NAD(P)/FAD-dependent oxidoreductase [Geitlerinemataceae cyanobacterium]